MAIDEPLSTIPADRCEVCGAKLTALEIDAARESGGPALCSVHADEIVPISEEDPGLGPAA